MPQESSGGPYKVYPFMPNGKYHPEDVFTITSDQALNLYLTGFAMVHIKSGCTLIVEDCDGFAVFHAENGEIIYPSPITTR